MEAERRNSEGTSRDAMTPADPELVAGARLGRREAFDELMLRYEEAVTGYLHFLGCRDADLEDLCQEIFTEAFLSLKTFQDARPFDAWLCGIARRVHLHHVWGRYAEVDALKILANRAESRMEPESSAAIESAEERERVSRMMLVCIESIPLPFRAVLYLKYWRNWSIEEIAIIERTTKAAIKERLLRARNHVKGKLDPSDLPASREHDP